MSPETSTASRRADVHPEARQRRGARDDQHDQQAVQHARPAEPAGVVAGEQDQQHRRGRQHELGDERDPFVARAERDRQQRRRHRGRQQGAAAQQRHRDEAAGDLREQVEKGVPAADLAEPQVGEGDGRIEVRAGAAAPRRIDHRDQHQARSRRPRRARRTTSSDAGAVRRPAARPRRRPRRARTAPGSRPRWRIPASGAAACRPAAGRPRTSARRRAPGVAIARRSRKRRPGDGRPPDGVGGVDVVKRSSAAIDVPACRQQLPGVGFALHRQEDCIY